MKKAISLALFLLLIVVVVVVIVGERSIHSGSQALVSHHLEPVVVEQDVQVSHSLGSEVASTSRATAVTENETLKPRHRGVYRPNRPAAQSVTTDWVRVPGTGVALWPKPASSGDDA